MHACLSEKQKRESKVVPGPSIIIMIIKKKKPNGIVNSNCKEVTEALDCMGYQATGEIKKIKSFKSTDHGRIYRSCTDLRNSKYFPALLGC